MRNLMGIWVRNAAFAVGVGMIILSPASWEEGFVWALIGLVVAVLGFYLMLEELDISRAVLGWTGVILMLLWIPATILFNAIMGEGVRPVLLGSLFVCMGGLIGIKAMWQDDGSGVVWP